MEKMALPSRRATRESIDCKISAALFHYQQAVAEWQSLKAEVESFLSNPEVRGGDPTSSFLPAKDVLELELSNLKIQQMARKARFDLDETSTKLGQTIGAELWENSRRLLVGFREKC
jgi:hypothetical protein